MCKSSVRRSKYRLWFSFEGKFIPIQLCWFNSWFCTDVAPTTQDPVQICMVRLIHSNELTFESYISKSLLGQALCLVTREGLTAPRWFLWFVLDILHTKATISPIDQKEAQDTWLISTWLNLMEHIELYEGRVYFSSQTRIRYVSISTAIYV